MQTSRQRADLGVREDDLRDLLRRALREDLGRGDVTSALTVPEDARASGVVLAKSDLVASGLGAARVAFELCGEVAFRPLVREGEAVRAGSALAEVEGPARALLGAERVALNLLMRLSGIATLTRRYVREVAGTDARVCDTRKTTPGLRALEKAAVRAGGGVNHRFGLDDGVLVKDNHLALAGGVGRAVALARAGAPHLLKVEVEVESREGLLEALEAGADAVLLDNLSPEEVREYVRAARGFEGSSVVIEVSGNVGLGNVRRYAEAGPDLISVGALTHSAPAADVSLDLRPETRA